MSADPTPEPVAPRRRRSRRIVHYCVSGPTALVVVYLMSAYVAMPLAWNGWSRRHPALDDMPRITRTSQGIHGDPLNLALVGGDEAIATAMIAAGWRPADPITVRTSLRLTRATLLKHPYEEAPVSNLYLWGRKQDLAFQYPARKDPSQRHHVRFWRSAELDDVGRPLWIGAATFDRSVGLSHTTGQITHHIAPDVDTERDKLLADLEAARCVEDILWIDDFHPQRTGRNGGGDPFHTDGRLPLAVLAAP
jgi:hypothetical protein